MAKIKHPYWAEESRDGHHKDHPWLTITSNCRGNLNLRLKFSIPKEGMLELIADRETGKLLDSKTGKQVLAEGRGFPKIYGLNENEVLQYKDANAYVVGDLIESRYEKYGVPIQFYKVIRK